MIIHKYSEWEEPEKPPFTLDDVVKAVTDMMMRYHVNFDEAIRYLMEQGLPYNSFMQVNGMDELIRDLLDRLQKIKEEYRKEHDLPGLIARQEKDFKKLEKEIRDALKKLAQKDLLRMFQDALEGRNPNLMYKLQWALRQSERDADTGEIRDRLQRLSNLVDSLQALRQLQEKHPFSGKKPIDLPTAFSIRGKLDAIDQLELELLEALRHGDLFNVGDEKLKEILGQEAFEEFSKKRQEMMDQFSKALQETGLVDVEEDTGVFKLTPAAARKVGENALQQVFDVLKTDGIGKHQTEQEGEGSVEMVKTRPYDYGDSVTQLDIPASLINALVRQGSVLPIRLRTEDMEVMENRGVAKTAVAVMIDMSGSMTRFGRFYNAKKVALALNAIIRSQFPEDRIHFVGFATYAARYQVGDIIHLKPKPITFSGSFSDIRIDMSQPDAKKKNPHIPEYFTNLQKGLEICRLLLLNEDSVNKHIVCITDGAPTAYYEGKYLCLTYPPTEATYKATLREVSACTEEGIVINTFMLSNEFDFGYFGEDGFVDRMLRINKGRVFYPEPDKLTQYVLVDYLHKKKKIIQI